MRPDFTRWKSGDTGHPLWPGPLIGSLLVGIIAGVCSLMTLGDLLEQRFGLWGLFNLRGARAGAEDVVIIALMSDTGDRISLPRQRSEAHPCADLRVDELPETHRPLERPSWEMLLVPGNRARARWADRTLLRACVL